MNKICSLLFLLVLLDLPVGCGYKDKEEEKGYKELLPCILGEDYNATKDSSLNRYKSVYLATADLDGDGVPENISIKVSPLYFYSTISGFEVDSVPAILLINKQFSRIKLNYNYLRGIQGAFTLNVVDIDTADKFKEVALTISQHGEDPPGNYQIFRYINDTIIKTRINGDNVSNDRLVIHTNKMVAIHYTDGYEVAYDVVKKFTLYKSGFAFLGRDSGKSYSKNPNIYLVNWLVRNLKIEDLKLIKNETISIGDPEVYQKDLDKQIFKLLMQSQWLGMIKKPINKKDISSDSNFVLSVDLSTDMYSKKLLICEKYLIITYHLPMGSDGSSILYEFASGKIIELPEMYVISVKKSNEIMVEKDYYDDGHVWETGIYNINNKSYKTLSVER